MGLEVSIQKKLGAFTLDVSFTTNAEVTGLLGQSGSGKSVTLQCIAGVMTPEQGRIVLDGTVLFDSALGINLPPQQRGIGYLFQHYALFPHWTVAQNLQVVCKDPQQVESMLQTMGLAEQASLKPRQLSGGQRQRLAMGRMLLTHPKAVLLDEPLSALDGHLSWDVESHLYATLSKLDCPVIWVTHDPGEVRRNCAQVCMLDGGHSQPMVDTAALFDSPKTMAAAQMAGFENVIPRALSPWPLATPGAGLAVRGTDLHLVSPQTPGALQCQVVRTYTDHTGPWTVLQHETLTLRMAGTVPTETVWVAPKEQSVFVLE